MLTVEVMNETESSVVDSAHIAYLVADKKNKATLFKNELIARGGE